MIKEGSMEVGGSRKSPAVTSATSAASVAPVQAMTLGDIVPSGTVRQKAALRQKITQRMQTEVSEFEAERRKAANKVKKRIEAQEEERKRKIQQERLEREWQRARERCDNPKNVGNCAGKGGRGNAG